MTEVEIEYCVPCRLLPQAQETQRTLLEELGQDLERVALKTGHGGVFKVRVDGEEIYDKADEGYDPDAIVDRVAGRVG